MTPEVLRFKEAKALLRCSDSVLLDSVRTGIVRGFKLGRTWRFYRNDLMALGEERGVEPGAESTVRAVAGKRGRT